MARPKRDHIERVRVQVTLDLNDSTDLQIHRLLELSGAGHAKSRLIHDLLRSVVDESDLDIKELLEALETPTEPVAASNKPDKPQEPQEPEQEQDEPAGLNNDFKNFAKSFNLNF